MVYTTQNHKKTFRKLNIICTTKFRMWYLACKSRKNVTIQETNAFACISVSRSPTGLGGVSGGDS